VNFAMKPKSFFLLLFLAVQLAGCSRKGGEPAGTPPEKPAESRVKHGANGETVITLDLETQKTMGLQVAAVIQAQMPPSIKAYGRVMDIGQMAVPVSELAAATAISEASQKEVERLKTLAGQNNTSQRSLQSAEAAATRDQALVQAARLRLVGAWGTTLARRADLPVLVQSLASLSNVLVQLNVPAGQALASPPSSARIVTALASNAVPVGAEFAGIAPTADAQFQGQTILFLVSTNTSHLAPGTSVTGYISLPGEPLVGTLLPRNAVVRFNGTTWVYRQISQEIFTRIEVLLQQPLPGGWFVGTPLKPEDKVVVAAAQMLLSEELKGQIEE
jgi:hypothetical protein